MLMLLLQLIVIQEAHLSGKVELNEKKKCLLTFNCIYQHVHRGK